MTVPVNSHVTAVPQALDLMSQQLVAARANAQSLPDFPGLLPKSLEDAYTIQTASIGRWHDEIGGWKVGMVPGEYRDRLGAERLAGPIFESSILGIEPGSRQAMPIFSGGFAAVEAEFVLRIGSTIAPVEKSYSDEELMDLLSAVHIGAEIASSPMAAVNKLGPCCVVSDFGNNAGLLVGPSIPNWSALRPESLRVAVIVDDQQVGSATASAIEGGLLQPLRFLIELCASRGLVLPAGTLVSSGAVTGIHEVDTASEARVEFAEFGSFDVAFESMQSRT